MSMTDTSDERLIRAVIEEVVDCVEQYSTSNLTYLLAELLEDGVDKRRVLADFVREGLYPDGKD